MRVQSVTFRSPVSMGGRAQLSLAADSETRLSLNAAGLLLVQQREGKTWRQHVLCLSSFPGAVVTLPPADELSADRAVSELDGGDARKRK